MVFSLLATAMPINVLGHNFILAYDAAQEQEDQEYHDVFSAILIGLTEYKKHLQVVRKPTIGCFTLALHHVP
jgi:hypothetical protein